MEVFCWGEHFVTGLAEVDEQHHHLVDIINQFSRLLTENVIHREDIDKLYHQLADYTVYHFQEEEGIMHKMKLDARHLDKHLAAHKGFLGELSSVYSVISPDDLEQAQSFLKFLIYWLAYHILGKDQDMAKQIEAIQSGMTPVMPMKNLSMKG